jgi:2-polyprenyl-3-methyl-5-hydroxy-6-metoxy-1,4-benzoquinol methylase
MQNPKSSSEGPLRTPAAMSRLAREYFSKCPIVYRILQTLRPRICPFAEIIAAIPKGARVLDVGCGGGVFLALLTHFDTTCTGSGFDTNPAAVAAAQKMRAHHPQGLALSFQTLEINHPWPEGSYDVVSMIDVLHHIPPAAWESVIAMATERVQPDGFLLVKDMASRPVWFALVNKIHDLLVAREWINHIPFDLMRGLAEGCGLTLETEQRIEMLWYRHELAVFRKAGGARTA